MKLCIGLIASVALILAEPKPNGYASMGNQIPPILPYVMPMPSTGYAQQEGYAVGKPDTRSLRRRLRSSRCCPNASLRLR
ncbi:unnamed protein product, partial [Mesorhabditis belari]|uniref:Uncharacterized protein n=1 Tax=Mesorhabditis belari TaxID=2138241 RepID=A0AAF3J3S5_9BILA